MTNGEQHSMAAEALTDIFIEMNSTLKLDQVLEHILALATRVVPHDASNVTLLENGVVQQTASRGWEAQGRALPSECTGISPQVIASIWKTNRPTVFNDTRKASGWTPTPESGWVRAHVGLPIRIDGRAIGVLSLSSRTPGAFDSVSAASLQVFADGAGIAIRNARLFKEAHQHAAELETLRRISLSLNTNRDIGDVLTAILKGSLQLLDGASAAYIFLYEGEMLSSGMAMWADTLRSEPAEEPHPNSLHYSIARQGELVVVQNPILGATGANGARLVSTTIGLPLKIGPRVTGVMSMHYATARPIAENELRILRLLGDQAVVAIENARYFERAEHRAAEVELLYDVATASDGNRSVVESLSDVSALFLKAFDASIVYCYLPHTYQDADGEAFILLNPVSVVGMDVPLSALPVVRVGDTSSWIALAVEDQSPETTDVFTDSTNYVAISPDATSAVVLPLTSGDQVIAAMVMEFPAGTNPYDQAITQLMLATANTFASVLHNVSLWQGLRESEQRFRQLAESVEEVFLLIDGAKETILYMSPSFEKLWGRPVQELYAAPLTWFDTFHPDDQPRVRQLRETRSTLAGTPYDGEHRIIRPDGTQRWIRLRTFPVDNGQGKNYRVTVVAEDITERKQADQQTFELAMEKQKMKLLAEFIRDVSHDFRTPLATINTSAYLLNRAPDAESRAQRIEIISEQVARLEQLLEGLMTITRLDQETEFQFAPVDMNRLAREIELRVQSTAALKEITLNLDLMPDLPAIEGDEGKLDHTLMNLLRNAVQYTPPKGTITVHTSATDEEILVEVTDTGVGIQPDELDRVFERFYRTDHARRSETGGIGLGLAIAKKIVERHGGQIGVDSQPGKGSRFWMRLPQHLSEASRKRITGELTAVSSTSPA